MKTCRILALILLLFTALNALIAGGLFILDPSGTRMGMSAAYLHPSPFRSFLIPGLVLFSLIGLAGIQAAYATWHRRPRYPLAIVRQGVLLSGWILVQVTLVRDFNVLHGIMLAIGILLTGLGYVLHRAPTHLPS